MLYNSDGFNLQNWNGEKWFLSFISQVTAGSDEELSVEIALRE